MRGATETITVWNRYKDDAKKDVWVRSVVVGCSWEDDIVRDVNGTAAVYASGYQVLIAENPAYMPVEEWLALSAEDKATGFTLAVGSLVARGEQSDEITPAFTVAMLKQRLDTGIFAISAFSDATHGYKRGRHYELLGV